MAEFVCGEAVNVEKTAVIGFQYTFNPSMVAITCLNKYPKFKQSQNPLRPIALAFRNEFFTPQDIVVRSDIDLFIFVEEENPLEPGKDEDIRFGLLDALRANQDEWFKPRIIFQSRVFASTFIAEFDKQAI